MWTRPWPWSCWRPSRESSSLSSTSVQTAWRRSWTPYNTLRTEGAAASLGHPPWRPRPPALLSQVAASPPPCPPVPTTTTLIVKQVWRGFMVGASKWPHGSLVPLPHLFGTWIHRWLWFSCRCVALSFSWWMADVFIVLIEHKFVLKSTLYLLI